MISQPKPRTLRDPKYLQWLRTLSCAWCGRPGPSEAAHMGGGGKGIKGPDDRAIPLCGPRGCHAYSHRHGTMPGRGIPPHPATLSGHGMREWAATVSATLRERWDEALARKAGR